MNTDESATPDSGADVLKDLSAAGVGQRSQAVSKLMKRPVTIVVLARYWEIFHGFWESVEAFAPAHSKILVRDPGGEQPWPLWIGSRWGYHWQTVEAPSPFSMARNANLGVKAAAADSDILYCGDDVRFLEPFTVERLRDIAYRHPRVGSFHRGWMAGPARRWRVRGMTAIPWIRLTCGFPACTSSAS